MIALPVLLPLLFALLMPAPGRVGSLAWRALPLASLPALVIALIPASDGAWSWLLLGLRLAPDPTGRALLLLVGLAWSASAWFAVDRLGERRARFGLFWCLALSGLCQSAMAADIAGFYLGYVAMTLAGYGLVVHAGSAKAMRAGRVYLSMALFGEVLVLSGLLLLGARYGNAGLDTLPIDLAEMPAALTGWLLLGGFSVKMGLVPLHLWLPLAHPVAPVPASAILSGVIVKAGLLGAVRLVPGETFGEAVPLGAFLAIGLFTAFYAVAAGLGQSRAKTLLAYSTISQMGLLFCGVALCMHDRSLLPMLPLLILHHGLNKAALFLSVACSPTATPLRLMLLALPALALAAAPLSGGALAKAALKSGLTAASAAPVFVWLLAISSTATALLMLRLVRLLRTDDAPRDALHPAWPLLVVLGLLLPWLLAAQADLGRGALWDALWPLLLAVVLYVAWQRWRWPRAGVPEGDLVVPLERGLASVRLLLGWHVPDRFSLPRDLPARLEPLMRRGERVLATLPMAGLLLMLLVLLIYLALARGLISG